MEIRERFARLILDAIAATRGVESPDEREPEDDDFDFDKLPAEQREQALTIADALLSRVTVTFLDPGIVDDPPSTSTTPDVEQEAPIEQQLGGASEPAPETVEEHNARIGDETPTSRSIDDVQTADGAPATDA